MSQGLPQLNFIPPPGYQIVDYLGGGAMGQVFKAVQTTLDRVVAIKTTLPAANPRLNLSPQRLLNEARTIAKLDHPGIVGIYDCFVVDDRIFIVMEYLDGLTLGDILYAEGPGVLPPEYGDMLVRSGQLQPDWVKRIGVEVARALHFAHRRGICHRDIKPSNLFITKTGAIKIIDFSIAIDAADTRLTATGSVIGSPPYMSPEQIRGDAIDGRSDIYSLGCVLFHAITGKVPFNDTSEVLLCMKHLEATPPDPASLTALCDEQLRGVILRCLTKNPENRFQTGGDLAQALETTPTGTVTVLRGEGGGGGRAAGGRPVRELGTGSRELAGLGPEADPDGALEDQATTLMESPSKMTSIPHAGGAPAETQKDKRNPLLIVLATVIGVAACAGAAWLFVLNMDKRLAEEAAAAGAPVAAVNATPEPEPTGLPMTATATATPSDLLPASVESPEASPVDEEPALPSSPFGDDAPELGAAWDQFVAWAQERGAREWPIAATALTQDGNQRRLALTLANTSAAPAEFSFMVIEGRLIVWTLNDPGDWSLRRTERPLAGWRGGAAFGDAALRLNAGESWEFSLDDAPPAGLMMRAEISDIRLAAVPAFDDHAATATLTADGAATATLAGSWASTGTVELEPGAWSESGGTEQDGHPVEAFAGTDSAEFSMGQAVSSLLVMTSILIGDEADGASWRERIGGRLALPPGHPPLDRRLRTVSGDDAAEGLENFLRRMAEDAAGNRLIDTGLYGFRRLEVDRFTGEIDLEFEFLAPESELEVSWFIVDGEQRLRAREGSESRELWRPLRGLHGMKHVVPVNRQTRSFTLSVDEVLSEESLAQHDLFYERTNRVVIRTMLVICAPTRTTDVPVAGPAQAPAFEIVTGVRWDAQP